MKRGLTVSVLTPSFNQARWLGDNLRSVACQSYQNIEHVVMDGGSSDGTVEILEAAEPRVLWRSEPDQGQSHALNKALAVSGGDILGWLNSDDAFFDCRVVEDVVAAFEADPNLDVVYGHAAYVNESGLILHYFWMPRFSARLLGRYNYIIQPAVFIRRTAVADSLVDESFHFAMDYELWLRLASQGRRFARIDRVLAIDRAQANRKSINLLSVLAEDMKRLTGMYGVKSSRLSRLLGAAHAIYCRVRGGGLALSQQDVDSLAFTAETDGLWRTFKRQCLTRRRDIEVGE